jgi:formylglycine-generating enzyme required for sulfatase activity
MGSPDGPADERLAHQVTLGAFSIDRLPVTHAQFPLGTSQHWISLREVETRDRKLLSLCR